jgi:hypothetical protein
MTIIARGFTILGLAALASGGATALPLASSHFASANVEALLMIHRRARREWLKGS